MCSKKRDRVSESNLERGERACSLNVEARFKSRRSPIETVLDRHRASYWMRRPVVLSAQQKTLKTMCRHVISLHVEGCKNRINKLSATKARIICSATPPIFAREIDPATVAAHTPCIRRVVSASLHYHARSASEKADHARHASTTLRKATKYDIEDFS